MQTIYGTSRIIVGSYAILVAAMQAVSECGAQSVVPYIPSPSRVMIVPETNGGSISVQVVVQFTDSCHFLGSWGQPVLSEKGIYVDTQFWVRTNTACQTVMLSVWTNYDLGTLPPGNYNFFFETFGTLVKTQALSFPLVLSILAPQADSQVQLCWNTATNAWYRVEYCSSLATNEWAPLTAWLPGNGNWIWTNDVVLIEQPRKFYRVAGTNTP